MIRGRIPTMHAEYRMPNDCAPARGSDLNLWGGAPSLPARHLAIALITLACLVAWNVAPAWAVIIFEKGKDQPTVGYLVRHDANVVVFREVLPNGTTRMRELPHAQVDDLVISVSPERLESLAPDKPEAYRDYAEELAEKRKDPDARDTSLRLYLIAAYLDPERLGRSCLLGMAALARSPAEERRFRAMAFLLDPNHDRSLLKPGAPGGRGAVVDAQAREALLKALRAFRRGDRRIAMLQAKRPVVKNALDAFSDVLAYDEFTDPKKNHSEGVLRKVLTLELLLGQPGEPVRALPKASPDRWSRIVERDGTAPVPSLTLESLTEFDPRQCIFRNGRWQAAAPEP